MKKFLIGILLFTPFFINIGFSNAYTDNNYIIYSNIDDGGKLYRKNVSDTGNGTAIISVGGSYPTYSPDGNYIIYSNTADGYKLYRKNASDSGNGTIINNVFSLFSTYSPDGNYIIYINIDDGGKLYRKNANDTGNGTAINSVFSGFPTYSPDGNYIVYRNNEDLGKLYRKDANNISNGIAINSLNSGNPIYSPDGNYIVYTNGIESILYRKNANDTGNGTAITTDLSDYSTYSPDGNYIVYRNDTDGGKLYRKNANDTGNGTAINSVSSISPKYYPILSLSKPTNLTQEIQSPYMDKEEISVGAKVGKFQSGSGVILSANMNGSIFDSYQKELEVEVYRVGESTPIYNSSSIDGKLIVPFQGIGAGGYYWKARVKDESGAISNWVEFGNNSSNEADFVFYKGFEPYPYGYSFYNRGIENGTLTGGILTIIPISSSGAFTRTKIDGSRWDIFNTAFPEYLFTDYSKMLDAFDTIKMESDEPFSQGNCFGLALSAGLQYKDPNYMNAKFYNFFNTVGYGYIRNNIQKLSTNFLNGKWDKYDEILKTILTLQLYQWSEKYQQEETLSKQNFNAIGILNEIKNNPNKTFLLTMFGLENGVEVSHAVIPYKVEGNKIYIWDNNYPFPIYDNSKAYEQYIIVNEDGSWKNLKYKWDFTDISIVEISDITNSHLGLPAGFNNSDTLIAFSGNSDFMLTDSLGRETGYKNGEMIKNIPGTDFIVNKSFTNTGNEENLGKYIYMPQKIDGLTIKISGKVNEKYDLMIAGGNYYTKVSGINTSSGQIDIYNSSNTGVSIDFDNSKIGDYTLLTDNFVESQTGTIFLSGITIIPEQQKYTYNWNKVKTNASDSITYQIDTDNDGIYDILSDFSAVPKIINEKGSISGYVKSTPSSAGWKICLDINNNGKCEENTEPFKVTNNTGYYEFANLEKGVYNIIEIPKNNWEIINPNTKKYTINLNNGQNFKNINFENKKVNGK